MVQTIVYSVVSYNRATFKIYIRIGMLMLGGAAPVTRQERSLPSVHPPPLSKVTGLRLQFTQVKDKILLYVFTVNIKKTSLLLRQQDFIMAKDFLCTVL